MEIGAKAFAEALTKRSEPKKLARVKSARLAKFCALHRVPKELARFLALHAYSRPVQMGPLAFFGASDLIRSDARCLAQRLLVVGCCVNGDPIVIDWKTLAMGFIRHDDFYEDEDAPPRDHLVKLPVDWGRMFLGATLVADFPCDSYAVEELDASWWKKLDAKIAKARTTPPKTEDPDGVTALHRAALRHEIGVVRALLAANANVNATDEEHATPLHYSVSEPEYGARATKRQVDVVKALLDAGAMVDAQTKAGETPLLWAVLGMRECPPKEAPGGPAMVRVLLRAGADKHRATKKRVTPMLLADTVGARLTRWLR